MNEKAQEEEKLQAVEEFRRLVVRKRKTLKANYRDSILKNVTYKKNIKLKVLKATKRRRALMN